MAHGKKVLAHHKRGHNSRRRAKAGDVFFARPHTEKVLPCGCTRPMLTARNELMLLIISKTRPDEMVWSTKAGDWVHSIATSTRRRFGRCLRHLPREELEQLKVIL